MPSYRRRVILCFMALVCGCGKSESPAAPTPVEQAFVGSDTCQTCHQTEYNDWRGSQHQLAMQIANRDTVLGDFSGEEFDYFETSTRFLTDGGEFLVRTENADGEQQDFTVTHTFGIEPLQQYLVAATWI